MIRNVILIATLFFCFKINLVAQVFWTEDFSNRIPSDWSVKDLSEQGAIWTWCRNPGAHNDATCPILFDPNINLQTPFNSSTATNGFAVLNSDEYRLSVGDNHSPHISTITTPPIDCSDKDEVFLKFESHIGVDELLAGLNALVQISTDQQNWTDFQCFPYLTPNGFVDANFARWSYNPNETILDISEVAANQETVYIRWYWRGNWEFYWAIDDISLTTENILRKVDLSIKPRGSFHAVTPNFNTPKSQLEPIFLLTNIGNNGHDPLENVQVIAEITNESEISLYKSTVEIPFILAGEVIENIEFPAYEPAPIKGKYTLRYTVGDVLNDAFPIDNIAEYKFEISESIFQKENGQMTTSNLVPNLSYWGDDELLSWGIANYFYLPKGDGYYFKEIEFGFPDVQNITNIIFCNELGLVISTKLLEWEDENANGTAEETETKLLGEGEFVSSGGDGMFNIFGNLKDPITGSLNIPLKDNMAYLIALDFEALSNNNCFKTFASTRLNYEGMMYTTALNKNARYASMVKVGEESSYTSPGLNPSVIPLIRMHIQDSPLTNSQNLIKENLFSVRPNPANQYLEIMLKEQSKEKVESLVVYNSIGQTIKVQNYDQERLNTSNLEPGVYCLKIIFEDGHASKIFNIERN